MSGIQEAVAKGCVDDLGALQSGPALPLGRSVGVSSQGQHASRVQGHSITSAVTEEISESLRELIMP